MAHKAMQGILVRVPCWAVVYHAINSFPLPPVLSIDQHLAKWKLLLSDYLAVLQGTHKIMDLLARANLAEWQDGWGVWSFEALWPLAAAPIHTSAISQRPSRLDTLRLTHTGSLATVASCKSQVCGLLLFQGLRLLPLEIDFSSRQTVSLLCRWCQSLQEWLLTNLPSVASRRPMDSQSICKQVTGHLTPLVLSPPLPDVCGLKLERGAHSFRLCPHHCMKSS